MGQQYIETIGMYGKKEFTEYPSESSCYDDSGMLADVCLDIIFNKQYGVFYYEPSDEEEAKEMIKKFREHIDDIEERWL